MFRDTAMVTSQPQQRGRAFTGTGSSARARHDYHRPVDVICSGAGRRPRLKQITPMIYTRST